MVYTALGQAWNTKKGNFPNQSTQQKTDIHVNIACNGEHLLYTVISL